MSSDLKSKLRWFTGEFPVVVSGVFRGLFLSKIRDLKAAVQAELDN